MSHIFLFGGKIGSNTALHCFVLQRKLIYSINTCKDTKCIHVLIGENTILNKKNICDHTLSPYSSLNLNLFAVKRRSFSSIVSVCNPLNISVVGGLWFCNTVTVGDHFPRIIFSL